jgi:hypothetical protein
VLNLNLESFSMELKDGSIKNVGPTNKAASSKLFDVESVEARAFGGSRIKVVASDSSGNEVQIALDPRQAETVLEDIESLQEGPVFE